MRGRGGLETERFPRTKFIFMGNGGESRNLVTLWIFGDPGPTQVFGIEKAG